MSDRESFAGRAGESNPIPFLGRAGRPDGSTVLPQGDRLGALAKLLHHDTDRLEGFAMRTADLGGRLGLDVRPLADLGEKPTAPGLLGALEWLMQRMAVAHEVLDHNLRQLETL